MAGTNKDSGWFLEEAECDDDDSGDEEEEGDEEDEWDEDEGGG